MVLLMTGAVQGALRMLLRLECCMASVKQWCWWPTAGASGWHQCADHLGSC